jgi:hypothetical protein
MSALTIMLPAAGCTADAPSDASLIGRFNAHRGRKRQREIHMVVGWNALWAGQGKSIVFAPDEQLTRLWRQPITIAGRRGKWLRGDVSPFDGPCYLEYDAN